MKVPEENIIVMGRSIGTGPACYLTGITNPRAAILISPFTSIRDISNY